MMRQAWRQVHSSGIVRPLISKEIEKRVSSASTHHLVFYL